METQQTIEDWGRQFGNPTSQRCARRSLEEMVELCVETGLTSAQIIHEVQTALKAAVLKRKTLENAPEEAADVFITLCQLTRALSRELGWPIFLQAEVVRKMQINRARVWALDGEGSGQHVDQSSAKL